MNPPVKISTSETHTHTDTLLNKCLPLAEITKMLFKSQHWCISSDTFSNLLKAQMHAHIHTPGMQDNRGMILQLAAREAGW